jgi:DNA-binding MarR family transcriptional regulator
MVTQRIGYQLKRLQQALRMAMDTDLRAVELTTAQYAALSILEEQPDLSGAALARLSFVTPQTMNQIIVGLEAEGLIARHPHPEHGRILQIALTPAGLAKVQQAHERVLRIETVMTAPFSTAEQAQLADLLQRCTEALGDG